MTLPDFDRLPDIVRAEKIAHMRIENLLKRHADHVHAEHVKSKTKTK